MSGLTQTEQSSNRSKGKLSRRKFVQVGGLLLAWLLAGCGTPPESDPSGNGSGLETTLKLMRGEMPSIKETVDMIRQLGIQKESQLAGIMIDLVRLQPGINIDELLNEIGNSNENINQRISDLLKSLSQEVNLFYYDHPINHRMAFAQARAREQGVGVNEYLAKELFDRVKALIEKAPDLVGIFPTSCPWAVCEQMGTIPPEIFQQIQLSLYYYEMMQPFFVSGYVEQGSDHLFMGGTIAQKIEQAQWFNNQGIIDAAHEAMLVALFPMVPEEFVFQNDEKRLGDRSSTIALFGEQLTDICLYLLRQSLNNEIIFQKIQTLFSQLQQQIDPTRIVSPDEVRSLLTDPANEGRIRKAISTSVANMAVEKRINLTEQFKPVVKPITVITFKGGGQQIVIPEETFPTNSVLHRTAKLFIPSHHQDTDGVTKVFPEYVPLLKTNPQDFVSMQGAKGLKFFYADNEIVAVSGQNINIFLQIYPGAQALAIQSINHKKRGELGAAVDNAEDWVDQGLAELGELIGIESKNSLQEHRVIGTIAVCKTDPKEYIDIATPLEHPVKSLIWITITQGPDNLYYAHNADYLPRNNGPHYVSVHNGILTIQTGTASDTTNTQQFRVLDEMNPGYYTATLDQIPQTLFEQFLRQVQPEETTKKIALLQRQAVLTTNSGGTLKKQYVVVPKNTATAYLVTRAPITGDIISQTEIGSFSRDPQPILGANLTTTVNTQGKLCLRLATIRRNGLGNGSPETIVMVPKDQVDVIEIPILEAEFQHHTYSQFTVFAAFSVVTKFLNTHLGGEFDLGYALYGALQELVRMNSGIGTDINP